MDIIPLTLALSLLLSLTFIVLFVREFSRPRRAGAEHDSLLPLAVEQSVADTGVRREQHGREHGADHDHAHHHGDVCASKRTDGKCCASCQRRKDRVQARQSADTAKA
jgi:ABC-type nickel/cobalt efflux system permease component RcnA